MFAECGSWTESIKPDKIDVSYELKFISDLLANNKNNQKLRDYYFLSIHDFIKSIEKDVAMNEINLNKKDYLLNKIKRLEEELKKDHLNFINKDPRFLILKKNDQNIKIKEEMIYAANLKLIKKPYLYNLIEKYNLFFIKKLFFTYNLKLEKKEKLHLELTRLHFEKLKIDEELNQLSNPYLDQQKKEINQLKIDLKKIDEEILGSGKIIKLKTDKVLEHVINKTIQFNKDNIYDLIGTKEENSDFFNEYNAVTNICCEFITNFNVEENKKQQLKDSVKDLTVEYNLKNKFNRQVEEIKSINIEEYRNNNKVGNNVKELKDFKI